MVNMKIKKMHIRLNLKNTEMVLTISRRANMTYSEVVNQLLEKIDPTAIRVEEKVETVEIAVKELKV